MKIIPKDLDWELVSAQRWGGWGRSLGVQRVKSSLRTLLTNNYLLPNKSEFWVVYTFFKFLEI